MDRNKARNKKPKHFRAQTKTAGIQPNVDRENGIIKNLAMISKGEALGHEMWIDSEMLDQVVEFGKSAGKKGVRARFTHPGLSSDGLGTLLGRVNNFSLHESGKSVIGDLSFIDAAFDAPDGNLAKHIMDIAEQAPEFAGVSIVFDPDNELMAVFEKENLDDKKHFVSPDKENTQDFPHVRIENLLAADIVDSPAANPNGLFFSSENLPKEAEQMLDYVFGITNEKPLMSILDINADRGKIFLNGYLARRELAVTSIGKECQKMNGTQELPLSQADMDKAEKVGGEKQLERVLAIQKYARELGQESLGAECIAEGSTPEQALFVMNKSAMNDNKAKEINLKAKEIELDAEIAEMKAELVALKDGRSVVGKNDEDNSIATSQSAPTERQRSGIELDDKAVEKYRDNHPGCTYDEATSAVGNMYSAQKGA